MSRPYGSIPPATQLPPSRYGGAGGGAAATPARPRKAASAALRSRMELLLATAGLLVPCTVFTVTAALLSFTLHYRHPTLSWVVVVLGFCLVVIFGAIAFGAVRRRGGAGEPVRDPSWSVFIFLTVAAAWVLGTSLGYANYTKYMRSYYDVSSLEMYPNVDPSKVAGLQFMDAGRIVFTKDTYLDLSMSYGFTNEDLYCVAPITSGDAKLASYDFWAVGVNCCNGTGNGFTCGAAQTLGAHSAMRLLDDSNSKYFRLAIEQVQLLHGIQAIHPLFFQWTVDPITGVNNMQDIGFKNFLMGTFTFFAVQLFLVILVGVGAFRMGPK